MSPRSGTVLRQCLSRATLWGIRSAGNQLLHITATQAVDTAMSVMPTPGIPYGPQADLLGHLVPLDHQPTSSTHVSEYASSTITSGDTAAIAHHSFPAAQ